MDKDFSRKKNMFCIFLYSSLKNRKKGHNNKVLNIYSGDNILSEYKTVGSWSLTFRKNYINGIGTDSVIAYDVDESTNQDQISFCQNRVLPYQTEFTTYGYTNIVDDCNNAQNSSTGIVTNRYYYHTNQLGSIIALTNSTGVVMQVYSYDAFGKVYVVTGNWTGTTMIDISTYTGYTYSNTRLYTGREYDRESGLYYLRARYYSPDTGRFINRDLIWQNDQVNLYTYVANSPLKYTDRNGKVKQILTETGERLLRWTADALLLVLSPGTASAPWDQTYDADMAKWRAMDDRIINPAWWALAISVILPIPGGKKKLADGAVMKVDDALTAAEDFLGKWYKELSNWRFVSEVEWWFRQVRMGLNDILWKHGGWPHINFEKLDINGKLLPWSKIHIFIKD